MEDGALIKLLHSDKNKGMEQVLKKYTGFVFAIVKSRLCEVCDSSEIEDCVSDVFIRFSKSFDKYDPQNMQITIVGDLFHWTITEYTATDSRYYAVDAKTFEQVACEIVPDGERPLAQRIERWLLPIRLRFTSWRSQLIQPNINDD